MVRCCDSFWKDQATALEGGPVTLKRVDCRPCPSVRSEDILNDIAQSYKDRGRENKDVV